MKKILLFGAGKSAGCLIDFLLKETAIRHWKFTIADGNPSAVKVKIGSAEHATVAVLDVSDNEVRNALIRDADLVISLLPPDLHFIVAADCVEFNKNLLTASYIDEKIRSLEPVISQKQLLFLCEMGLDPGIDHMSAMDLISRTKEKGSKITSFRSHTGGLTAPESDNNPWHYKISWNPRNVVTAGRAGAVYKKNRTIITKKYEELFSGCNDVSVPDLGSFSWYPNRDSLGYISVYQLEEANTFIRTTLRHPLFCEYWQYLVKAGLTSDEEVNIKSGLTIKDWAAPLSSFVTDDNIIPYSYLGLFGDLPIPSSALTNADVLQNLLETRLAMQPEDKDMIVMLHELDYEIEGEKKSVKSSLVVKGIDRLNTAMAKTVGLPLGIAAVLILEKKIELSGLHIPILPEIYIPVMSELKKHGIQFSEVFS